MNVTCLIWLQLKSLIHKHVPLLRLKLFFWFRQSFALLLCTGLSQALWAKHDGHSPGSQHEIWTVTGWSCSGVWQPRNLFKNQRFLGGLISYKKNSCTHPPQARIQPRQTATEADIPTIPPLMPLQLTKWFISDNCSNSQDKLTPHTQKLPLRTSENWGPSCDSTTSLVFCIRLRLLRMKPASCRMRISSRCWRWCSSRRSLMAFWASSSFDSAACCCRQSITRLTTAWKQSRANTQIPFSTALHTVSYSKEEGTYFVLIHRQSYWKPNST